MPRYSRSNINHIIDADEFKALYNHCRTVREQVWVISLWLTGARPQELIELIKKDIVIEEDRIKFHIKTMKLKKTGGFIVERRNLVLHMPSEERYVTTIKKHLSRLRDDSKVFQFSQRTGYNIIKRLGQDVLGVEICPYNFRHSRMTLLAEKGLTEEELKRFKGARSRRSVAPYLHARKVEYSVEVDAE